MSGIVCKNATFWTVCVSDCVCTHIYFVDLLQAVDFFDRVHFLLPDEVGDGRHRPLTSVLPFHHHPISEELEGRVLADPVALRYISWKEKAGQRFVKKLEKARLLGSLSARELVTY